MDLLLTAKRAGPNGHAIGIEMTDPMVERPRTSATLKRHASTRDPQRRCSCLAVLDDSIDVVISNGVLNLVPERERGFAEIIRLLKPGGCLHLADIELQVALAEDARRNNSLWSGRIAGALPEAKLLRYLAQIGLEQVRITKRFDCFRVTSKEKTARK